MPTKPGQEPIAALREILDTTPSHRAFCDMMALLESNSHKEDLQLLIDYADGHMDGWPDEHRRWQEPAPDHPGWPLVRVVSLRPQYEQIQQDDPQLQHIKAMAHLTGIDLVYMMHPERADPLGTIASYPLALSLRTLRVHTVLHAALMASYSRRGPHESEPPPRLSHHIRSFPHLRELNLSSYPASGALPFDLHELRCHKSLEKLSFSNINLAHQTLPKDSQLQLLELEEAIHYEELLSSLPPTTKLRYHLTSSTDELPFLAQCPQLNHLLIHLEDLDSEAPMEELTQLESLEISLLMDSTPPEELYELHQLKKLRISAGPESQDTWPDIVLDLSLLAPFSQLEHLDVNRTYVERVESLGALTSLTTLHLHGCELLPFGGDSSLDDAIAACLPELTQLEVLSLPNTLTDLSHLATLPRLRWLQLTSPSYGDGEIAFDELLDDLDILQDLPQLEQLHIGHKNNIESIDISGLPNLRSLHIEECHALKAIIGLDKLPASCHVEIEECPQLVTTTD